MGSFFKSAIRLQDASRFHRSLDTVRNTTTVLA